MLIPNSGCEVSEEWLSEVLKITILPKSFKLIPNAEEGTGLQSEITQVKFKDAHSSQLHNIILKLLPSEQNQSRNFVLKKKLDQVEIRTYQNLFPELIKIIPELDEYLCQSFYGEIQEENENENIPYASVLILEDLKSSGYFMLRFYENFGELDGNLSPCFLKGLDFLAKFHAASFGLERKQNVGLLDMFKWLPKSFVPTNDVAAAGLQMSIPLAFPQVTKLLGENSSNPTKPELLEAFKNLEMSHEIVQKVLIAGQKFPCAVHRDLWNQNILVKKDGSVKIIDWQALAYGDPAFDLSVYILECLPTFALTKENILKSVKIYFEKYEEVLKTKLGMESKRYLIEFEEFFQTFGLAYCLMWFVLCCVNMWNMPNYPPKVLRIFEVILEFGVFDFLWPSEVTH